MFVTPLRKWRDAARQRSAVGGEIHQSPRPTAERPGVRVRLTLEADARLRSAARSRERHAERFRQRLRRPESGGLFDMQSVEQRLVRSRQTDGVRLEIDETLQMDFPYSDAVGDFDEGGQFGDGLFQARQPYGDRRLFVALALLQIAKGAHVPQNAVEIVPAAHAFERLARGGVERNAQFVETGVDQSPSVPLVQDRAVRVEQNVDSALLEVTHHGGQIL